MRCIAAAALALTVAGCSNGGGGATAAEVAQDLEPVVTFADLSDGVVEYYADVYFDAAHLLTGRFDDGEVLLLDRPSGYERADAASIEAAAGDIAGGRSITMLEHDGVAVVVLSDDAGDADVIRAALDD